MYNSVTQEKSGLPARQPITEHRARGQHCSVIRVDGTREQLPTKFVTHLQKGEKLRIETPGGGGWGDPRERDRDALGRDVAEGLVSPERAREFYGAE